MNIRRSLNPIDAAKLAEADTDVPAQKFALALLLIDADGRLEQYAGSTWEDLPPMFRWMAHKFSEKRELRLRMIRILQGDYND